MQFSLSTVLLGLIAVSSAAVIDTRQANGQCCIPNVSLKQDNCNVNGQAGKCVPGGPGNCNGALNCVATNQLICDNNVSERSGNLCRFQLANGRIQDGANQITDLSQAKVN